MSIIHDALKKAKQSNLKGSSQAPSKNPTFSKKLSSTFSIEYDPQKSKVNWGPFFIMAVLLLITGPIVAPIFSTSFHEEPRHLIKSKDALSGVPVDELGTDNTVNPLQDANPLPENSGADTPTQAIYQADLDALSAASLTTHHPPMTSLGAGFDTRKGQFAIEESPLSQASTMNDIATQAARLTPQTPNLVITGVVLSSDESYCIINDKVVRKGDKISGATLRSISKDGATLEYEGQNIILPVN